MLSRVECCIVRLIVLLGAIGALAVAPALADPASIGANGIQSQGLTLPGGGALNGNGISIGQIEVERPGLPGFDNVANSNATVTPQAVFRRAAAPTANALVRPHPEEVAGVMISTGGGGGRTIGVSPSAKLYASGYDVPVGNGHSQVVATAQHIAAQDANRVRAINYSFGEDIFVAGDLLAGNSLMTLGLDWLAQFGQQDVLNVIAGNERGDAPGSPGTSGIPLATDNYNGMTIGYTQVDGAGVFRVLNSGNTFDEDAAGRRRSVMLVAPGTGIVSTTMNNAETGDSYSFMGALGTNVDGFAGFQEPFFDLDPDGPGGPMLPNGVRGANEPFVDRNINVGQSGNQENGTYNGAGDYLRGGTYNDVDGNLSLNVPVSGTSFSAPLVTATVALLQQYGENRIAAGDPNFLGFPRDHRVMKSVLMNSADKVIDDGTVMVNGKLVPQGYLLGMTRTVLDAGEINRTAFSERFIDSNNDGTRQSGEPFADSNDNGAFDSGANTFYDTDGDGVQDPQQNWLQSDAFDHRAIPLDEQLGAGQLNAARALKQFAAGEQDPGTVPMIGWDAALTTGLGDFNKYVFDHRIPKDSFVSITLAWDRQVTLNDTNNNFVYDIGESFTGSTLTDLDLYLLPAGATNVGQAVWSSVSTVDSVEHIFYQIGSMGAGYTNGMYEFWVRQATAPIGFEDYGVSWWAIGVPEPTTLLSALIATLCCACLNQRAGRRS